MNARYRPIRMTSFLLAAAVALCIMPGQANACFCDCYYSSDCGILSWCVYNKCIRRTVNGKLRDGECKFLGLLFASGDIPNATQALDLWLQAYESAAGSGGGPPDAALVAAAQAVPLTSEQHEVIRQFAMAVQEAYLGLTSYSDGEPHLLGFFTPATITEGNACNAPFDDPNDHGSVAALDACHLAVGAKIREAIIGEMQNPGMGVFSARMAEIPSVCPTYVAFGRCEFPHPPEHGHPFPYADGLACLEAELGRGVESLLSGPMVVGACCLPSVDECLDDITEDDCVALQGVWHAGRTCAEVFVNNTCVPATSTWGLAALILLVVCAGTVVLRRGAVAA